MTSCLGSKEAKGVYLLRALVGPSIAILATASAGRRQQGGRGRLTAARAGHSRRRTQQRAGN